MDNLPEHLQNRLNELNDNHKAGVLGSRKYQRVLRDVIEKNNLFNQNNPRKMKIINDFLNSELRDEIKQEEYHWMNQR